MSDSWKKRVELITGSKVPEEASNDDIKFPFYTGDSSSLKPDFDFRSLSPGLFKTTQRYPYTRSISNRLSFSIYLPGYYEFNSLRIYFEPGNFVLEDRDSVLVEPESGMDLGYLEFESDTLRRACTLTATIWFGGPLRDLKSSGYTSCKARYTRS